VADIGEHTSLRCIGPMPEADLGRTIPRRELTKRFERDSNDRKCHRREDLFRMVFRRR
jgi:hypothetical protein